MMMMMMMMIGMKVGRKLEAILTRLTATATPEVQADIVKQLNLEPPTVELFHEGIDRPNLGLNVEQVWDDDAKYETIVKARTNTD